MDDLKWPALIAIAVAVSLAAVEVVKSPAERAAEECLSQARHADTDEALVSAIQACEGVARAMAVRQ